MTIKQASEQLNMNYSSAKAILSLHKKSNTSSPRKITQKLVGKMSGFAVIEGTQGHNGIVGICSSIGGLVVSERPYPHKTKPIHKEGKYRRETDHEDSPYTHWLSYLLYYPFKLLPPPKKAWKTLLYNPS